MIAAPVAIAPYPAGAIRLAPLSKANFINPFFQDRHGEALPVALGDGFLFVA
jgi:hypothetical protein